MPSSTVNYLAHLTLCERDTQSIVGNLLGDFSKYHRNGELLPEKIAAGIAHHRRIDRHTDSHEIIAELKQHFSPARRRFAGIILDVAFDHFLSKNWPTFCNEEIEAFIQHSYECISDGMEYMPEKMQWAMQLMIKEDWLGCYSALSGIDSTLNRMARRIRFENSLSGSVIEIERNYEVVEAGFLKLFHDLIGLAQQDSQLSLFDEYLC